MDSNSKNLLWVGIAATLFAVGIVLICLILWETSNNDVIVVLPNGKVKGRTMESLNGSTYYGFFQIYYAASPVGPLRYMPPQEREPWKGTLDGTRNTVACYQLPNDEVPTGISTSEDCLYVNVFTPVKPGESSKLFPVYIYIFGGEYTHGFAGRTIPIFLMDYEIVVVAISYRMGKFGFLSTEDDVIPGNLGLKDQKFALKWVHRNIKYFNGNAKEVTLGGGSSGAASVGLHLIGPWDSDEILYHRAIQQSNSPIWNLYHYDARKHAFDLGRKLDPTFNSNDSMDLLKLLQAASADDIVNANQNSVYYPLVEKTGDFSYKMLESYLIGNFKKVPLLIGFNSEERLRTKYDKKVLNALDADPANLFNSKLLNIQNKTLVGELYKKIYTNNSFSNDFPAFVHYYSDDQLVTPVVKQAELFSKYNKVYLYQFSRKGDLGGYSNSPIIPGCERVSHGEEMGYIWGYIYRPLQTYSKLDQLASHRMVKLWANFIKSGNPTPTPDPLLENITWPALDPIESDAIRYLNINDTLDVRVNPRSYKKAKSVLDKYLLPPYIIYTNSQARLGDFLFPVNQTF